MYSPEGMLDHPVPREMTIAGITRAIGEFATAAGNAMEAGFDGVEVHGANGYLIHQFLADGSNVRTDAYGGPVANRIRFAVEAVQAVADAIGPQRTGIRISPGNPANGITESDTADLYRAPLRELAAHDLAYLAVMELGAREATEMLRA